LSIHSNALNTTTNYLLLLYHGYDNIPTVAASLPMAQKVAPILFSNQLTVWTSSAPIIRGDFTFYGDNLGLGVLRPLTVPGFLSEGSFHDYPPETHRLLNDDYCKLEAIRFFQHFHEYFQKDMPQKGTIGGWVKSGNEIINVPKFTYKAGSDDQWLPVNGAVVKLLSASGQELQTATVDNWYNGIFAFYDLDPGNYKLSFSATNYESKTEDITVEAGKIVYAKAQLKNIRLEQPDYPDPEQEAGVVASSQYDFENVAPLATPTWLSGANIKRAIFRNGKIYVLTAEPKIRVINAQTNELIKELNLNGLSGGTAAISDIAFTADDYLLACNKATFPDASAYFKVYTWNNDDAVPSLLFQTQQSGFPGAIVGETFAVSGSRWNCKIYASSFSTSMLEEVSPRIAIVAYQYNEDTPGTLETKYLMDVEALSANAWGDHPLLTLSPSGAGDHLYLDSETLLPTEYQFDRSKNTGENLVKKAVFAEKDAYTLSLASSGGAFFRYAQHTYLAMPAGNTDATQVGVVLFDVTEGLDKAVKVSAKYPENGLGEQAAAYMAAGAKVTGYDIELWILAKNQGIARFKTLDQVKANIYASELSVTADKKFRFTLNENAESVFITLSKEGETLTSYNAGALAKGRHTIDNPFDNMEFDFWSVTATTRSVNRPVKISDDSPLFQFYGARGVAVDNTPESPFFGRIYVTESAGGLVTVGAPPNARSTQRGIYILNAAHEDITNQGTNSYTGSITWSANSSTGYQYAPMRPAVAPDGKLYISDSSYGNSGIYILDPANPSAAFKPVFGGTRNPENGQSTENGVIIHNPVQNCYIMGTGANTQLFTLDRTATPVTGKIQRYDIGRLSAPWTAAPNATVFSDLNNRMQNSYGTIAYDSHGGWWLSQYRAGGGGTAVPVLIHATNNVEDFNVGSDWPSGYQGVVAVSLDGSTLALGTEPGKAQIFDVAYDAANKPALTPKFTIEWGGTSSYLQDAAFDVAGNLYLISNGNERLMIYALPKADNSFTTRVPYPGATAIKPIESGDLSDRVSVYPNPVVFDISIDGQGLNLQSYALYDINGRLVRSGKLNSLQSSIPAADLQAGVYILHLKTAESLLVKRIIKK
jgi:hypothetical protein